MISQESVKSRMTSTRDFAYEAIKKQIIKGDLSPDKQIVEEKLASELDISRTPLREALQRLEIEELVVRRTNGRLKVAPISIREVEEVFTIRKKLEVIVVGQATDNATKQDVRHLKHISKMFEETCHEGSMDEILYYGGLFHSYIYDLSGNKTAVKLLYQLNDHIDRYRRYIPDNITRQTDSIEEHNRIIHFISKQDTPGSKQAMEDHMNNSLKIAIQSLQESHSVN